MRIAMLVTALAVAVSGVARAQVIHPESEPSHTITFTPVDIDGNLDGPGGTYMKVPNRPAFKSLIVVRANFTSELMKSVDKL